MKMKMTIGRKLAAGFAFLLAMFILVGIVTYTLNIQVLEDVVEVSEDDVPSVILALSLLNKIENMDANILKYMTGEATEKSQFEANKQTFLTFFEELSRLETEPEKVKLIQQIERLFLEYTKTTGTDILARYDSKLEPWASQQADFIIHQYGLPLKEHLKNALEVVLKDASQLTDEKRRRIQLYLVLLDKTSELEINLSEYVNGIIKARAEFMTYIATFETNFKQMAALKATDETTQLNKIFSLYTQLKQGAEDIFHKYDPNTKKEVLATTYRLEREIMAPLQKIINRLANDKKTKTIAATNEIILIIKEITDTVLAVIGIAIIIGLTMSILLARSISLPLALLVKGSQQLVAGDIALQGIERNQIDALLKRSDEIGVLTQAFDEQTAYFKSVIDDIVSISKGLAEGNLRVMPQAEYRGDFLQIKISLETALINQRLVIEDIVHVAQGLADGNLSIKPQSEYQGEFRHVKNAQETVLANQRQVIEDIVQMSQGLAKGNLGVVAQAQYRGDFIKIKEALDIALSNLRKVIEDIVHVSQGLAESKADILPEADYLGDFRQIKLALETAALKLAQATAKNAEQDWFKTGQTQLNDLMSGEQNLTSLAKKVVTFVTTYTEAQVGLFYLLKSQSKQPPSLQIIASYAYTTNDNIPTQFLLGEGLVGQAALEKKPIFRTHTVEEHTAIIQSGLTKTVPHQVLIMPFLYEDTVKGVIEIGFSKECPDKQKFFVEQIVSGIGIAINTAQSRTKMQELLEQSQQQSEELQVQSEELKAQQEEMQQVNEELQSQREELQHKQEALQQQNEELQSQAEEMQSQSEELQTQQEELKQTNEALEERTKELEGQKADIQQKNAVLEKTQADMQQTQTALKVKAEELELASRYKSEFLANMSHELRTPLNSLLILAQLLAENKQGNLTDKQQEYARTIHSAGYDLLTLINEILDLAKVEAGKMEVHLEEVSLTDLVETVEHKFRAVADEQALTFNTNIASDLPPTLRTDVQRLKQIINNLLSNAFKFTAQGEVRLEIQYSAKQTKTIAFSIIDTGIGIPEEKQKVIFEAFQQVDGSTSRRFGGTGLGLSISRQFARLLGGELKLHSEEGKGSTFTLSIPETGPQNQLSSIPALKTSNIPTLPTKEVIEEEAALSSPASEAKPSLADDRNNLLATDKSLLIIEDDRKFLSLMIDLAHDKQFKCLVAEDGQTGLQMAEQYQPNAIILDVGLPNLDGWTVMEILKDNPDTRHIPIHFISGADDYNTLDAKKKGALGYLHKPVNMEQLGTVFKQIEQFITKTVKNLLVVGDNEPHQQKILDLVKSEDVETTLAVTIDSVVQHLKSAQFDCIILDMDIEQGMGSQLLKQMQNIEGLCQTPVIIYAQRELTPDEEALLLQCADHLPIKPVKTPERLLDETTLFLHQLEANLPNDKRNMLRMVHDKEAILAQKKVLIVDDDARNIFALAIVLEEKNMEVIAGNNGNEALDLLNKHPDIAIILMDIMMPEMDGYEAMHQIRKLEGFRKLPIIALTAKAMKGDKVKCIEAGANDYLSKPVDTNKLISLMRVWLYR
jgi:signal transduction histidine kinase/DNA-binding response OmpR family regulator/methyl-accepting chemotaxis protein